MSVPLDFAFIDRAVLRVPKADDIKAFLTRMEEDVEAAWTAEKEEQEALRAHMRKRAQQFLELKAREQQTRIDVSGPPT